MSKLINFSAVDGVGITGIKTRQSMVDNLSIEHEQIKSVMVNTPRHYFVNEAQSHQAYHNISLPIGLGQTISQPQIVAQMSTALMHHSTQQKNILEVGTGCGYQTAILAQLFETVYSIERIEKLHHTAKKRLQNLHIDNVHCFLSDGSNLQKDFKFDAIILTAAPDNIPQHLINLLNKGGCLIAPEGSQEQSHQHLICITFDGKNYQKNEIGLVDFVPMLEGVVSL